MLRKWCLIYGTIMARLLYCTWHGRFALLCPQWKKMLTAMPTPSTQGKISRWEHSKNVKCFVCSSRPKHIFAAIKTTRTMVPSNVVKLVQHTKHKSSIRVHTHMYTRPLDMADRFIVMAIGILAKGMQILQTYVLKNLGSISEWTQSTIWCG